MARNSSPPDLPEPSRRPGDASTPEVVSAGSGDEANHLRVIRFSRVGTAVAVAVVLVAAATWADRVERSREFDTLSSKIDSSQQSVSFAVGQVASTRSYTMPLLVTSSSATVRTGLEKLIDQAAARQVTELQVQRRRVEGVFMLTWHRPDRRARARYVGYLDARIATMESMARGDGQQTGLQAEFSDLQDTAAAALAAAAHSGAEAGRASTVFNSPPP